jgi:hypothetical protein
MLLLCCLFASRIETCNIDFFLMFKIKDFEVYKGVFMYIIMDMIVQYIHYFNNT